MLARMQRVLVVVLLALGLAWWFWSGALGLSAPWRWSGLILFVLPHAPVLALEFLLLAQLGRDAAAPRASAGALLRAWAGEVATGLRVFGWRQPWRANAEPDHLPALPPGTRRGVVLVHGFVCNRGLWTPWLRRLRRAGVPCIAVNLEPVFGSIDDYVPIIDAAVARMEQLTGLPPLIVAHSMGGLATRAWLQGRRADARCAGVVTVGTPHHGTWLARLALSPNGHQMRRANPWLRALASAEPPQRLAAFTCFYSHCDNIVFPATTATLTGADNRHLPGTAHLHLVERPEVFEEVMRRLASPPGPPAAA